MAALVAEDPVEEGIPVTDALVISRCGTCHTKDAKGNLSRISWERTTPEGWEQAIKRMVRLNGLTITPAEARSHREISGNLSRPGSRRGEAGDVHARAPVGG